MSDLIKISPDELFTRHLKEYPELRVLISSLLLFYKTDEELKGAIFYGASKARHILPAIDRLRINEVFVGKGEVTFFSIMTKTGSRDDMYNLIIEFKFNPGDEIKFINPTYYRHSLMIEG